MFALLLSLTLTISGTRLLDATIDGASRSEVKIIAHEGSTGSSKTISIAQAHLIWSEQEAGKVYTVTRATMPALKRGPLRDWQNVLSWARIGGHPAEERFEVNRSDWIYTHRVTGTRIEFVALDHEQKARGPRRDRLWANEANELSEPLFRQMLMRTRGLTTIDYNPSMTRSWIYDDILTRKDCLHIHSTYLDNPHLSEEEIREIEHDVPTYREADGTVVQDFDLTYTGRGEMISGDPYRWAVFGLGRRGSPSHAIYPIVRVAPMPETESVIGIDFGFTNPTVALRVSRVDRAPRPAIFADQLVHESYLTTGELIERLSEAGVTKQDYIYADSEDAKTIEEIKQAGFRIQAAKKGAGSVYAGIMWVKGHDLYTTPRSMRTNDELVDYRWLTRADGSIDDRPAKVADHAPDALRYACDHWRRPRIDYSRP